MAGLGLASPSLHDTGIQNRQGGDLCMDSARSVRSRTFQPSVWASPTTRIFVEPVPPTRVALAGMKMGIWSEVMSMPVKVEPRRHLKVPLRWITDLGSPREDRKRERELGTPQRAPHRIRYERMPVAQLHCARLCSKQLFASNPTSGESRVEIAVHICGYAPRLPVDDVASVSRSKERAGSGIEVMSWGVEDGPSDAFPVRMRLKPLKAGAITQQSRTGHRSRLRPCDYDESAAALCRSDITAR
ncbi:hypothetical protein CSOJ01_09475 [Colletotrichum sojae]|uniref:Uncharacterized protein n=1 Tax=Colletotrichum sojae TaxID=2175907 RepID=A0A8H6J3U8_9PEZI|nr:hypothetical protein CSOJ01_09475 [Colletotrichum sojae]